MRGQGNETRAAVVQAAQQMMKGADPEKFIAMAAKMPSVGAFAKPLPGEPGPAPVNIDTIGGISGLTGTSNFDPKELAGMASSLPESGHEGLLQVLAEKRMKTDPLNPDGPQIIVEAIDELDGSKIVDIMNTLAHDHEWDQFLTSQTRRYLDDQDYDKASELSNRIKNPILKIRVLGEIMGDHLLDGNPIPIKLLMARVRMELDKIKDPDIHASTLIALGGALSVAGSKTEPASSLARVETMIADTSSLSEKAVLQARLAVAFMEMGNKAKARLNFGFASRTAGQITEPADRISVFTRIALRYFDARNTTLANEILAEAEVLAATQLEPQLRARVFGEIAMARGYMGDFVGANLAINNGGKEAGRQQLVAKLAEVLIVDNRFFEAMGIMESLEDHVQFTQMQLRIFANFIYSSRVDEVKQRLGSAISRARQINEPSERGLLLSQLARIAARVGEDAHSEVLFKEALENSDVLEGRKSQLNRGLVALDRARLLHFRQSQDTLEFVTDIVVRDPIGNEIAATERTAKTLLPESLLEKEEED
jgi:hypothetical protein